MFMAPSPVCAKSRKVRLEENDYMEIEVKEQSVRAGAVMVKTHPDDTHF
jgi:hypothetical protein